MSVVTRNVERAQRVIDFIERLTITIGETAGQPFILREWQKQFIRDIYEPQDEHGRRVVRRAVLSVARKNGKSELSAALVLVHLIGPEAEMNGEVYTAANSREQAAIIYNGVKRMVEAEPALRAYLTVVPSTKTIFVHRSDVKGRGSKFRALSAEAGTQHGLNPSAVFYDELAQSKSRELLDTLTTSQGARSEPLFLTISTQSNDPQHPLSEMIDDGLKGEDPSVVAHLYAANDNCDLLDEAAWSAANPALGDFRSLDELRVMAARAVRLPSEEQAFRLLYLNQRVAAHASLIAQSDWKACGPDTPPAIEPDSFQFEPGEAIYLGLDMSARIDLTALVAVSAEDGSRVKSWFWKPEAHVHEHGTRDRFRYDLFVNQGWMTATPGRSVDPEWVAHQIAALHASFNVRGLAYDRAHMGELLRCLAANGVYSEEDTGAGVGGGLRVVPWGQGFVSMGKAINAFEHAVVQGELRHDGNPVLTWNVMNAIAVSDPAGNRKLDKSKVRFRIDGAVALAMALGLKAEDRTEVIYNPWDDPTFSLKQMYQ